MTTVYLIHAVVGTFRYRQQRSEESGGTDKPSQERLSVRKNSKGHLYQDEEQGLDQMLEEEFHGDMHIDEANLFNDTRESEDNGAINQECLAEGIDDVTTPLLDKATEKESKEKKTKRIRDDDKPKGDKKRKKSDKERVNKLKKEKTEDRSSNKEYDITETTSIDMQEVERKEKDKDKRKEQKGAKRGSKGKGNSNT